MATTLRIAMLTTFYPPFSFGGDAVGIQRLARAMVRRGHDVTVIHDEDSFLTLGGTPGTETATNDDPRRIGLRSRFGMFSNLLTQQTGHPVVHGRRIRELLGDGQFDIIWHNNTSLVGGPGLLSIGTGLKVYEAHEHWLVCPMHVLWRFNRELCDAKRCFTCTLSFRRPPQWWRWTGMLESHARDVDLFVAKSAFSRDKHREFGFAPEMEVIPYFLPDVPSSDEAAPHERPYFLFVGRLEKIKGLQEVIPVFEHYEAADLVIAGDGEYRGELERLARDNPRVRFLGRMPVDELNALYKDAISLIVPSICYETFGIILIESFRLGTPVIARRLGPFPEIIDRANCGSLFSNRNDLVEAMRTLQESPEERALQSIAARRAFEEIWSEGPVMEAYQAALIRAARRKGDHDLERRLEAGAFTCGSATG